jgi:5-methylcytosine-specific restriction endonuclease McrA
VTNDADALLCTSAYRRLRLAVLDRDGWLCQIHGPRCTTYATVVDHVVSRVDGGAVFDPSNMRAACRPCNAQRAGDYGGRRQGRAGQGRAWGKPARVPYRTGWGWGGGGGYATRF